MTNIFRIISYLEGISYLLLLFVGVPLKYFGGNEILVKTLGMPHGLLFIAYILIAFFIRPEFKWSNRDFVLILIASVIPFGTFYVDRKFLKNRVTIKS
jgi:integral membrane protein